jgi:integrase/recombinase XerC
VAKTGNITELDPPKAPAEALATPQEEARVSRFLEGLRAQGRRPATIGAYESDWRRLAEWSRKVNGEPFDLSRMVGREAAEFRNHCLRLDHAPATVNRRLVFLVEYARWAAGVGEAPLSLADEVAKVPRVPRQALAPRGLGRQELRRFLKEVDLRADVRDKALVYLLLYTGLRLGEAARLGIGDVALSPRKGILRVRSEWAKGGKERLVPVPAAARRVLAEYLVLRGDGPGPVFLGQRGPLGRNGVARIIGKYARAACLRLSPHTLRHCFAYRYLEQTANDLVGLAALLGHSSLNTTMGYTRKRMEDLEAAVEDLEFT